MPFYHDALREYGRDPAEYRIKTLPAVVLLRRRRARMGRGQGALALSAQLYRRWYREAGDSNAPELTSPDDLPRANYIVGTPDDCERAIRALHAELPFDEFIFWACPPGFPVERATRSLELFAREVTPRFPAE